jgi:hypothetical protein
MLTQRGDWLLRLPRALAALGPPVRCALERIARSTAALAVDAYRKEQPKWSTGE